MAICCCDPPTDGTWGPSCRISQTHPITSSNMTDTASQAKNHEQLVKEHPKIDEFLLRKWERIFNVFFDRNDSHQIDAGDFHTIFRKCREIYGAESKEVDYAKKSLDALWEGLCKMADANDDELISLDEWVNLMGKVDPNKVPKWFSDYSTFMFKLFDVSADGVMDLAEYTDGMCTYGFRDGECHKAFQTFAVDKKGEYTPTISPETWNQYFHEQFFSTDKKALGNHLFGVMDI